MKTKNLKNCKCILCDIDGTLYNWSRILSPKTKEVFTQLHNKGYLLGLASGRPYEELCEYAKSWDLDFDFDIIIGLNGAELFVNHQLHEYYKLSKETLKEVCELMFQFECNPFLYWHKKILCKHIDPMMIKSGQTSNRELVECKNIDELWSEDNAKIMFRMSEDELKKVEDYMTCHTSDKYIGFKTQSTLFEFMDPHISKGFGIDQLCNETNITHAQILAFGDTTNDNSMLEKAGWGICLKNGSQDTKDIADEITKDSCDQDGFANYIIDNLFEA
ncbi:HAD family hydrolase [Floccifex sp.]|uniref:HAD family hydrolase n=1 Tax=Floccifex sp. TaxID=2815810 RepID=UPI002A74A674|nr:HAD family hydrolase [Floccifex sp.]MDD7281429.1 HAD family hydrolase [Erysipelotrichaceae bacterium]MDY2957809.1 HAD family hydrolase [Floccifex sp.]